MEDAKSNHFATRSYFQARQIALFRMFFRKLPGDRAPASCALSRWYWSASMCGASISFRAAAVLCIATADVQGSVARLSRKTGRKYLCDLFMKVSAAFVGRFEMYPPFVGRKTCRSTTCHYVTFIAAHIKIINYTACIDSRRHNKMRENRRLKCKKFSSLSRVNVASQLWQHTMSDAQTNARWQMTPRNYFIQSSDWMAHDDRFAGMLLPMRAQRRRVGVSVLAAQGPPFIRGAELG